MVSGRAEGGEVAFIAKIREQVGRLPTSGIIKGIGDDCAVLRPVPGMDLVWTTDSAVEEVHFRREWATPYQIGWRAVMVNLSDIASMGAQPLAFLAALTFPPQEEEGFLEAVVEGLCAAGERYGCPLVGGNLSQDPARLSLTITMLGSVETGGAIYRSGAQVGDEIWVTGTLGDAYAGLRVLQEEREEREAWEEKLIQHYLQPVPRVREALWLRSTGFIHSMIDLSDGLSSDLGHICQESRVGVRVEAAALPLSEETRRLAARRGEDPLEYALHGGEDFELCFTASPGTIGPLVAQFRTRFALPLSRIGEVGPAAEPVLIKAGQEVPLTPQGYDHFRKKRD